MSLNFPSSPVQGQTYTYAGKPWQFDGIAWRQKSDQSSDIYVIDDVTVSGPVNASSGQTIKIRMSAMPKLADTTIATFRVGYNGTTQNIPAELGTAIADITITGSVGTIASITVVAVDSVGNYSKPKTLDVNITTLPGLIAPGLLVTGSNPKNLVQLRNVANSGVRNIIFANNLYVAAGDAGSNNIVTSADLVSWTTRLNSSTENIQDIVFGNNLFVAVGFTTGSTGVVRTSSDGVTWTSRTVPNAAGKLLREVTWTGTYFIAVTSTSANNVPKIIRSTDGITWEEISDSTTNQYQYFSVEYAEGVVIAVGALGVLIRSTDNGATWQLISTPVSSQITGVAYGLNKFLAVGASGVILSSSDLGLTWTTVTSGTSNSLIEISFGSDYCIVGGVFGTLLYSFDLTNWNTLGYSQLSFVSIRALLVVPSDNKVIIGVESLLTSAASTIFLLDFGTVDSGTSVNINRTSFPPPGVTDSLVTVDYEVRSSTNGTGTLLYQNSTNSTPVILSSSVLAGNTTGYLRSRFVGFSLGTGEWSTDYQLKLQNLELPSIGTSFLGGFFAGTYILGGVIYAIIVSPKSTEAMLAHSLSTSNIGAPATALAAGAKSLIDGNTNTTELMTASATNWPAVKHCWDLDINGYTDWYLPSLLEHEIIYKNLKPTDAQNVTLAVLENTLLTDSNTSYDNTTTLINCQRYDPTILVGTVYANAGVASSPGITSVQIFQGEGSQEGFSTADQYWSSSMPGGRLSNRLNGYCFRYTDGTFGGSSTSPALTVFTNTLRRVRAIRREIVGTL